MTPAIMLSFVIPALVAVTLTVLLIKERDYLFNKKSKIRSRANRQNLSDDRHYKNNSGNHKNDQTYVDYSGGMMGL